METITFSLFVLQGIFFYVSGAFGAKLQLYEDTDNACA